MVANKKCCAYAVDTCPLIQHARLLPNGQPEVLICGIDLTSRQHVTGYWHHVPGHSTLLAITVFTPALAGCLLLLSWLQHRRVTALALWGSGFIIASVATTLIIVLRGTIPNFWSIIVGNALLSAAYGILWSGARKFEAKKGSIPLALVGVSVWLVACSTGPIYARTEARATVMAQLALSTLCSSSSNSGADVATKCGAGRSWRCCLPMLPPFQSTFRLPGHGRPILIHLILPTWIC